MTAPLRLLFVCSGNITRSPMAERLARQLADELGVRVETRSAGTLGISGRPADSKATDVCREVGIDLADHISQGVSEPLLRWADHVLVMELEHAAHLRRYYEDAINTRPPDSRARTEKLLLLGPFGGAPEVTDPTGGWTYQYRRTRELIAAALQGFFRRAV